MNFADYQRQTPRGPLQIKSRGGIITVDSPALETYKECINPLPLQKGD